MRNECLEPSGWHFSPLHRFDCILRPLSLPDKELKVYSFEGQVDNLDPGRQDLSAILYNRTPHSGPRLLDSQSLEPPSKTSYMYVFMLLGFGQIHFSCNQRCHTGKGPIGPEPHFQVGYCHYHPHHRKGTASWLPWLVELQMTLRRGSSICRYIVGRCKHELSPTLIP